MGTTASVSLCDDDLEKLKILAARQEPHGITQVFRVGLQHLIDKPSLQRRMIELEQDNARLYRMIEKYQKEWINSRKD